MSTTPNLLISHIAAAQNQKEVTANTAFDDFDEALCANVSLAMTDANYTVVQATALQNMVLVFTGTLTADRTVTLPANKKPWIVSNQTTGGFSLTFKVGTATNTVVLTGSGYTLIYCDGTNSVYNISDSGGPKFNGIKPVNITGHSAAIAATTLYAVPSGQGGIYRISWAAKVTTVSDTSSILGGTNGFQIKYTDADDSVVVTTPSGPTSASNLTNTQLSGEVIVNAKAGTNLQYLFDYTDVAAYMPMQFSLYIRVEKL